MIECAGSPADVARFLRVVERHRLGDRRQRRRSPRRLAVAYLRVVERLSLSEAAARLGITPKAADSHLQLLREELDVVELVPDLLAEYWREVGREEARGAPIGGAR